MRRRPRSIVSLLALPALLFAGACAPEAPATGGQVTALWGSGDPPNRNGRYRFERTSPLTQDAEIVEEVGLHIRFVFDVSRKSRSDAWTTFSNFAAQVKHTTPDVTSLPKPQADQKIQKIVNAAFPACMALRGWTPPAGTSGARAVLELVLDHSPDLNPNGRDLWLDCEIWRAVAPQELQEDWKKDDYLELFKDDGTAVLAVVEALFP